MKSIYSKYRTIGILGGSFNPAHEGHLHISQYALNKLGLDSVWWVVSPHNPLKQKQSLAEYEERMQSALSYASDPRIFVSDVEQRQRLQYTYETLCYLTRRYPGTRFVWMMGADNLVQFSKWQDWRKIIRLMPIVVFDRAPYSNAAKHSHAYQYLHRYLVRNTKGIPHLPGHYFLYCHLKRSPFSSTQLRKTLGKAAFLRHNKGVGK